MAAGTVALSLMMGSPLAVALAVALLALAGLLWKRAIWVGPVVLVALHALAWNHHVDDAGIDYAYARNIADGLGLVAQPGGPVVEGTSNPLWLAALTLAELVGMPADLGSSILQLGCMLVALWLGRALAGDAGGSPRQADLVLLAIVGSGVTFAWTTAGLEGALLSVLLLGAALAASRGLGPVVFGVVVLAAWVRPEGAMAGLAAATAGYALSRRWRGVGWAVAGALLGLAAMHGLRWWLLGTVWPTSVVAKTGQAWWRVLAGGGLYAAWCAVLAGVPFLAVGLWGQRRTSNAVVATCIIGGVGLGLAVASGGDWMRHGRFLAPYVPVVLALSLPTILSEKNPPLLKRIALVGLAVTGGLVLVDAVARPTVPIHHGQVRGALYTSLSGDACDEISVATPDIGGVLWYFPEVALIDLVGLIDPEASVRRRQASYWPARLRAEPPAIVDLHGRWAERTGLSDATMDRLGYRIIGRRIGATTAPDRAPTLWLHARCQRPLSSTTRLALDHWVERGSGGL